MTTRHPFATSALCATALVGFAANSLLCRGALGTAAIDAASFTAIRLTAGAIVLFVLARRRSPSSQRDEPRARRDTGSWLSAVALFAYAAAFSYAYLRLTAATGALILFAAVQATMIGWGVRRGERPRPLEWLGAVLAAGGLVGLTLPGLAAPDPIGAALMAVAGISWGVYSLRGRGSASPLAVTADNFARTLPLVGLLVIPIVARGHATMSGGVLAGASGALASGVGYSLWYAALPHMAATRAAIVQLVVPVLTAVAAVVLLDEAITARLAGASAAILGGIGIALASKRRA